MVLQQGQHLILDVLNCPVMVLKQQNQHLMLDVFNCPIMYPQRQALGSPCAPFSGNDITATNKTFDSRCVQLANNGRAARFMLSLYVFNFPSMVLQQKHI
jgi:hypothetical protein